jgi:hypothetical protein
VPACDQQIRDSLRLFPAPVITFEGLANDDLRIVTPTVYGPSIPVFLENYPQLLRRQGLDRHHKSLRLASVFTFAFF